MTAILQPPGAAEWVSHAVGVDIIPGRDAVARVVEGVVRRSRSVLVQTQNLAAEGVEIERRTGVEAVAIVYVKLAVWSDGDV